MSLAKYYGNSVVYTALFHGLKQENSMQFGIENLLLLGQSKYLENLCHFLIPYCSSQQWHQWCKYPARFCSHIRITK